MSGEQKCARCGGEWKVGETCSIQSPGVEWRFCSKCFNVFFATEFETVAKWKSAEAAAGVVWYVDSEQDKICFHCRHYPTTRDTCMECYNKDEWQFAFRGPADRAAEKYPVAGAGVSSTCRPQTTSMPPSPQKVPAKHLCGDCGHFHAEPRDDHDGYCDTDPNYNGMIYGKGKSGVMINAHSNCPEYTPRAAVPLCAICGKEHEHRKVSSPGFTCCTSDLEPVHFCLDCGNKYLQSPEFRNQSDTNPPGFSRMSFTVRTLIAAGTCPACRKPFNNKLYDCMHDECWRKYTASKYYVFYEQTSTTETFQKWHIPKIAAWLLAWDAPPKKVEDIPVMVVEIDPAKVAVTTTQYQNEDNARIYGGKQTTPHCALCEELPLSKYIKGNKYSELLCYKHELAWSEYFNNHYAEVKRETGSMSLYQDFIRRERRARCNLRYNCAASVTVRDCYNCNDYEYKLKEGKRMSICEECKTPFEGVEGQKYCQHCGTERKQQAAAKTIERHLCNGTCANFGHCSHGDCTSQNNWKDWQPAAKTDAEKRSSWPCKQCDLYDRADHCRGVGRHPGIHDDVYCDQFTLKPAAKVDVHKCMTCQFDTENGCMCNDESKPYCGMNSNYHKWQPKAAGPAIGIATAEATSREMRINELNDTITAKDARIRELEVAYSTQEKVSMILKKQLEDASKTIAYQKSQSRLAEKRRRVKRACLKCEKGQHEEWPCKLLDTPQCIANLKKHAPKPAKVITRECISCRHQKEPSYSESCRECVGTNEHPHYQSKRAWLRRVVREGQKIEQKLKSPKLPRRKEKLPAKCRRCMKENKLQRENVERCAKDHPDLDCSFKDMKSPKPPSLRRLRREYYSLAKVAKRQEDARRYNDAIAEMKWQLGAGK